MASELGHYLLIVSWLLTLYGLVIGGIGLSRRSERVAQSVCISSICAALTIAGSLGLLSVAFLQNDYSNQFVWQFSNRDMPWIYKITAVWGGMDGSMLLWAAFLAINTAILVLTTRRVASVIMPWVVVVANSSVLFFSSVTLFVTNPFRYIKAPFVPVDGNGLNPLLQNPYMAIHPPMLYSGFTTFAIPFAFCVGALLAGELSNEWLRLTRRWTLIAWGLLTVGITLGGHWAYLELGWGGFWAWDPVENASFLPWLTGTAFLHSVMVQERKNMLKVWNVWLVALTYGLTVFGTFLTRSGVVQSIHAFASTDIGWVFLLYLGLLAATMVGLTFLRRAQLRPERVIESAWSREAFFLMNNLLFLSICFAVLWGVMFPVFSEAITGEKQTIGIPFFNAVTIPMFLGILFLMGVGPMVAWRKANLSRLVRQFVPPALGALSIAAMLLWLGVRGLYPILSYSLCWFVTITILSDLHRIARSRGQQDGGYLRGMAAGVVQQKSKYAGHLVHFGVVVAAVSITASTAHKLEREFVLHPGERFEVGPYSLELQEVVPRMEPNFHSLGAIVLARQLGTGAEVAVLRPEMRRYLRNNETTSEVALHMGWRDDLYLVVAGYDDGGQTMAFKVFVNPLQIWLWLGVGIMALGTICSVLPGRKRRRVTEAVSEKIWSAHGLVGEGA